MHDFRNSAMVRALAVGLGTLGASTAWAQTNPLQDLLRQGARAAADDQAARLPIEIMLENETRAVRALRSVVIAQLQCRATGAIDVDRDGRGEFATFAELAGAARIRDRYGVPRYERMSPPVLSSEWGRIDDGVVFRDGYCFAMILPGVDFSPFQEAAEGGSHEPGPWPNGAEQQFACYAWPQRYGVTGELVFCVDQDGSIAASSNRQRRYGGLANRPAFDAARMRPAEAESAELDFRTPLAFSNEGRDGQFWQFYDVSFGETRHGGGLSEGRMVAELDAEPREVIPLVLRRIASAQAQCAARAAIDTNRDGVGEYGFFGELTGVVALRERSGSGLRRMQPAVLGPEFSTIEDGVAAHRGYCFRIVLPGRGGRPVLESRFGGVGDDPDSQPDANFASRGFTCYAWPLEFGLTGREVYAIDADGRILVSSNETQRYSGVAGGPGPRAAYEDVEAPIGGPLLPLRKAVDDGIWSDLEAARPPR